MGDLLAQLKYPKMNCFMFKKKKKIQRKHKMFLYLSVAEGTLGSPALSSTRGEKNHQYGCSLVLHSLSKIANFQTC